MSCICSIRSGRYPSTKSGCLVISVQYGVPCTVYSGGYGYRTLLFWSYSSTYPGAKPGCFGHTPVCTWVPNLVNLVILTYVPGYQIWLFWSCRGRFPGTSRVYEYANAQSFFLHDSYENPNAPIFFFFFLAFLGVRLHFLFLTCSPVNTINSDDLRLESGEMTRDADYFYSISQPLYCNGWRMILRPSFAKLSAFNPLLAPLPFYLSF